ncbi:DUF3987 domain-containing protein [Salmonella enterica subsp. enterica serovar Tamberma]|nr:DUF3987 domain-containing protein [Salmonella enterica subsp. enterica serovar Tamberma]EBU9957138.1 DUF3987 domain-containing protein [Salmonella enterica subsp. enterica serovar Tamberma]EBX4840454.1 DUF3987 domain-containing protein [Salmonella enterica subsp. enterica serovar Tamberma]MMG18364.1 DUF3987 domain-containing protein [Salmonella enterica subsp. enterica serovar Tamberma]
MNLNNTFPVDVLPSIIRNAIYEVERNTQAPLPLIAASALGAISLVCQNSVNVCRLNKLRSPVSLCLVTLAESGERKSTVDKLLMEPLYHLEEQLAEKYSQKIASWKNDMDIFNIERRGIESKLKADSRSNKDLTETNIRLTELLKNKPKEPVKYKFIFNDATPAAIKDYLCKGWRSIGIMSDEAGTIFNGYALNELPFINKMWDGAKFSVVRKNAPEQLIKEARLTLSLMIQPDIFNKYLERKGDTAKGIGFFARCLICKPFSTQGFRQITNPVESTEHLPVFHQRLLDIVEDSIAQHGKTERICLCFDPEAERQWLFFYNQVEGSIGLFGFLSNFKDYASKMAENAARVAALLHYFSNDAGNISLNTINAAIEIITWYMNQHIQLFSKPQPLFVPEVDELYNWIKEYCYTKLVDHINKNKILQCGPNRFRYAEKLNVLLATLRSQGRVNIFQNGKTKYVQPVGLPGTQLTGLTGLQPTLPPSEQTYKSVDELLGHMNLSPVAH